MKKRILCIFFSFLLLAIPFVSFADVSDKENDDVVIDMSTTSIEHDFNNYLTGLNLSDYKADSTKKSVELIAALIDKEYLYLYVYNPAMLRIYEYGTNYVNASIETDAMGINFDNHSKYELVRKTVYDFNVKTKVETDALIIKYQLKYPGYRGSNPYQLGVDVSELELRLKNGVISYPIGKKFIFTQQGAADIYNVTTYSSEVVNIKSIGHTYYRLQGNGANLYQDIMTAYFAVDKELIKKYLEFSTVKISWEECELQPILLVDNKEVEKAFDRIAGQEPPANFRYSFGTELRPGLLMGNFLSVGHMGSDFNLAFNASKLPNRFYSATSYYFNSYIENIVWAEKFHNTFFDVEDGFDGKVYTRELDKIYFTFYTTRYDSLIPGEKIMLEADIYDGVLDGMYSSDIILSSSGKLEAAYNIDQADTVGKYNVKSNYYQYLLNGYRLKTKADGSFEYDTFERFYQGHLKLSDEKLGETYLINNADVAEFRQFVEDNQDKEIYILRYSVIDTKISPVSMFGGEFIENGWLPDAECYVCNASLVDTVLINDLDVIQLGFDNVKGGYTAIGVSAEPIDFVPDVNQFPYADIPDDEKDPDYFGNIVRILLIAIGLILLTTLTVLSFVIVRFAKKRGKKNEKKNN